MTAIGRIEHLAGSNTRIEHLPHQNAPDPAAAPDEENWAAMQGGAAVRATMELAAHLLIFQLQLDLLAF
jgi:hypothetical protein